MKRPIYYFSAIFFIGLTVVLSAAKPAAAENQIVVTITEDIVANDGECSLREAIASANFNIPSGFLPGECPAGSATETDVILLEAGEIYTLTIQGADEDWGETGDLDILNDPDVEIDIHVKVIGEGMSRINAGSLNDRIWHVHPGAHLVLEGIDTRGGSSSLGGGLYNQNGQVTLTNTLFTLNTAVSGGAIANDGVDAILVATNTEIVRNTATAGNGGGIFNQHGALLFLVDSLVNGNDASNLGGGLANGLGGSATVSGTRFTRNEAGNCGGAVANWEGMITLSNSQLTSGNSADQYGGGLCNALGVVDVSLGSVIEFNESGYYGGGIINNDVMTIHESVVRGNKALNLNNDGGFGGGLYTVPGSETTISRSAFLDNTADHSGGAILAQGTLNMDNSTLSGNFAIFGGGMLVRPLADVTAVNVTIAANASVAQNGVGLLQEGGELALGNSLLDNLGGNCYQSDGTFVSLGHNLASDDSCPFMEAGDLNDVDPLLLPQENGAHQLQGNSPAIDAGDTALCEEWTPFNVDQVGQARPKFNGCDIGAVEWQGFGLYLPIVIRQ